MAMRRIGADRRRLLPLLLMGDEQESLVERYLDRCGLYVWEEAGEVLAVCAAERTGPDMVEILNLAVAPEHRRRGIGRRLLLAVCGEHPDCAAELGTGETPDWSVLYVYEAEDGCCLEQPYEGIWQGDDALWTLVTAEFPKGGNS